METEIDENAEYEEEEEEEVMTETSDQVLLCPTA